MSETVPKSESKVQDPVATIVASIFEQLRQAVKGMDMAVVAGEASFGNKKYTIEYGSNQSGEPPIVTEERATIVGFEHVMVEDEPRLVETVSYSLSTDLGCIMQYAPEIIEGQPTGNHLSQGIVIEPSTAHMLAYVVKEAF